tara:strand:- start:42 stop:752 length:711 start_codon:yes stop_codon:yes gene_type:complete
MASYNANQLTGAGTPIESLPSSSTYDFELHRPSSLTGSCYFTMETKRNAEGAYTAPTTLISGEDLTITTGFSASVANTFEFDENTTGSISGSGAILFLTTAGTAPNCTLIKCEVSGLRNYGDTDYDYIGGGSGYVLGETITVSQNDLQAAGFANADASAVFTIGISNLIPTNAVGIYNLNTGTGSFTGAISSSHIFSVVVQPTPDLTSSFTFTPTANIAVSSSFLRATGGVTLTIS